MRVFCIAAAILFLSFPAIADEALPDKVPGIDVTPEGLMIAGEGIQAPAYGDIPPPLQLVDFDFSDNEASAETSNDSKTDTDNQEGE